ncbi:amidohydrolase family protein [Maribacter polysaccharolyticus]|uniref:amidohydrolase family protein n=1 Tax=Maribacter polysaccharolyticus TaxID=3020831 RepID=UPI00237F4875|nr:amidohydrolase family protein [Maribacter polysaccharolyticus]MDE3743619.1 amidohydrolase family protein [Maribacter polysaccharolyticus]
MRMKLLALTLFWCGATLFAQDYFPDNDGVKSKNKNYTAFTNAKIYITPTQVVDQGTLLIQNGKVVQVGTSVTLPKNTVTIDLKGKTIYPSFIDIYSDFGVEKPKRVEGSRRSAQFNPTREGFYWNDHIMPENDAIGNFKYDDKKAEELRKAGFGVVNSHIQDGIARGTGVLIALNGKGDDSQRIIDDRSGQYFSFTKSVASNQSYPTSLMGAIALLRQMYIDADWYAKGNVDTKDRSLKALNANKGLVQIFDAGDKGNIVRADGIGDANGIQYAILGGGDEYETIADIKNTQAKLIIPLNFPDAYDVSDPYQASYVSLEDMRHWNQAPANPKILAANGVTFSFTLNGLKSPSELKDKLQKAITYGLPKTKALEALTTVPAQIMGRTDKIGSLQQGRYANFLITSGDIFDEGTTLYENWVQGTKNTINDMDLTDIRGDYTLKTGGDTFTVSISGEVAKPKTKVTKDTVSYSSKMTFKENWMQLSFSKGDQLYRLSTLVKDTKTPITGKVILSDGQEAPYTLSLTKAFEAKEKSKKASEMPEIVPVTYPNVGYGYREIPQSETILFKNATVWTSEDAGILENTDVLIKDGKISKIGKDLKPGRAKVVDATGKHLTAGIIDEHSHLAALAVNESGQNSSAEVTMEDVVDPEDIGIYRNLGGGVTTLQLLHGSANPIGGRSAILKLKWGESAENMIYDNSPKFIKFALGENVKQSNWGSFNRFPQTRMGVEQVFMNYFQRAKEYEALKKSGKPYRKDAEMETLVEIINGERFISCHSYVQSEINMLMKVAEKFNFKVNTFTHILEGYKVADKMLEHGVGASTFSDWWAYKYEVKDAIPYNAAIMQSVGLTVAINSDDAEMSRRLNQEAGKTVKYGGVSELEAWKMVTINPAKLLHIDERVGSIKEGKDADLVLWSDHPLSIYAKPEKTLIEGAVYFDLEKDQQQRAAVTQERSKLIGMMLKEKESGAKTQGPRNNKKETFHCDSL